MTRRPARAAAAGGAGAAELSEPVGQPRPADRFGPLVRRGEPVRRVSRAADRFAELGAARAHVSLTHSETTAVAVVIIEA